MDGRHEDRRSGAVGAERVRPTHGTWTRWVPWIALVYILLGGLFVAWAKMETTQLTYEVHQLRSQQSELQREHRLLNAELASLRAPAYLSQRADEIGLQEASAGAVRRVE